MALTTVPSTLLASTTGSGTTVVLSASPTFTGTVTTPSVTFSDASAQSAAASPYVLKNRLINGNFDIWQRGTSVSTVSSFGYAADRWRCGGTMTASRQTFTVGQTEVPNNPKYYMQVNVTADSQNYEFQQRIEGVQTFAGQAVTISYYARRTSGTVTTGLNLVQDFGSGGSPSSVVVTSFTAPSYTTSWQKFTATATLPSISGKTIGTNGDDNLYLSFQFSNTATGVIEIAQVQVESGSTATPFEQRMLQTELALCQRYYTQFGGTNGGFPMATSYFSAGSQTARFPISFPVTMRTAPTITKAGTWGGNASQPSAGYISTTGFAMELNSSGSGMQYSFPDSTDDLFKISAEFA